MYYSKLFFITVLIVTTTFNLLSGQGNCLLYEENSGERKACELSYQALEYSQGSKESQHLFDQAIRTGPKYAWAYYEKSVPYFKRGLFAEGVSLINKAIELEPQNYLFYRAYWYFYNRSYELCIRDLEELYKVHKASYVTTPGGELEMRILLALAYAQKGKVSKGINWIENLMEKYQAKPHLKGYYDHFCLGVLYYKNGQHKQAQLEFAKQLEIDADFADTYYFLGLIENKLSNYTEAKRYFQQALLKINGENGGYSINIFTELNTYKEDIEKML